LSKSDFTHVLHRSVAAIDAGDWNAIVKGQNMYLSLDYLKSLESTMTPEMDFLYTLVYNKQEEPVLVGVFQLVTFLYKKNDHPSKFLKHFHKDNDGNLSMNMLVCGNVFAGGENGFMQTEEISYAEAIHQMVTIILHIKKEIKTSKKITVMLFKEFWSNSFSESDLFTDFQFQGFQVDVNMILRMHPSWKTMEDYLFSMKTKFRTKAKGVFKKSNSLELRSLSYDQIVTYQERIKELFKNVVEKSQYTYGAIKPQAFGAFKKALGDAFSFRAAFYQDTMVGFSTSFFHKGIMEANYVGMDYQFNQDLAVYQRLLYDYVEQGISKEVTELQFGRTSELLKSSLGAEPTNMTLFARHKATIPNIFMASMLRNVSPSEFELRKPFKSKFMEEWIR